MSHIDCTEQVLLIWCATHCAGVPARQVFLAPDLDDSSHGGEANALSTTLIPSLAQAGITDFAVGANIRVAAIANGSQQWNETQSGQFSDVCTSDARPWQSCVAGNCTPCDPLTSTTCRTCFFPRLLGAAGVTVMPQLYFFSGSLPGHSEPPWTCSSAGRISDGHCNPMSAAVNPDAASFSWFNDTFWSDVASTFAAVASYTCASGGRSITLDQEGYFGYMRCPNSTAVLPWGVNCSVYYGRQTSLLGPFDGNSMEHEGVVRAWNWLPNGSVTHADRLSAALARGRQVARAAAAACPGISISIYSPESDLTDLAWMAGLATPEVGDKKQRHFNVTKINRWGSPYYRDRERPADADVAMTIYAKWKYIAEQHATFNMTADQAKTLLLPRSGVAIWSTVYYERRYLETCCDRYNASALMVDKFDEERAYQTAYGRLAYFDIDPSFAEAETQQLQELADVVGLYPGVRDYACVSAGAYCANGDDSTEWNPQATATFPDTRSCWRQGQHSCYSTLYRYFSPSTLNERATRIADAMAALRRNTTTSTTFGETRALAEALPTKINGTQTWNVSQLSLPTVLPPSWEVVSDSGRQVLQTTSNGGTSGAPIVLYTPGTVYDIAKATSCTDSTKCGGGAPVTADDVYLELQIFVDRSRGFGDTLLIEGTNVCSGQGNPCADLPDNSWGWVRVRRQYLQSVRSSVVVTSPPNNYSVLDGADLLTVKNVRIGAVRYVNVDVTDPRVHRWTGIGMQTWITGRGWQRNMESGSLVFDPALPGVTQELSFTASQLALPGMPLVSTRQTATHMELCVEIEVEDISQHAAEVHSAMVQFQPVGNDPRLYRNGGGLLVANTSGFYRAMGQFCFSSIGACTGRYGPNWRVAVYPVPGSARFTLHSLFLVENGEACSAPEPTPSPPQPAPANTGSVLVAGTSDHLMFDDHFTQNRTNLELKVQPPPKSGVILKPEFPWEPMIFAFNGLVKVNESDYRLYYDVIGAAPQSVDPSGQNGYRFTCVAMSKDGLTGWTKPMLDLVPFTDFRTNTTYNRTNIIGGDKHLGGSNIIYDAQNRRFVGLSQGYSYISDDGFFFTLANCRPTKNGCICGSKGKQTSVPSCRHLNFSAPNGYYYDDSTQKYNVFFRTLKPRPDHHFCPGGDPSNPIPPHERAIGMIEVADLLSPNWGPGDHSEFAQYGYNTTVFAVDDDDDPCLSAYSANPFKLGDMLAIAPMMFLNCNDTHSMPTGPKGSYPRRCEVNPVTSPKLPIVNRKDRSDGLLEAHLAVSRDGRNYTRLSREAFVPRGIGHPRAGYPGVFEGALDAASTTVATGSYNIGDQTVMVASGWQATHAGIDAILDPDEAKKIPGGPILSGLQLLTARRNGFVALQTTVPSVEGVWFTKPLWLPRCNGNELGLTLNAMASIDGYVTPSVVILKFNANSSMADGHPDMQAPFEQMTVHDGVPIIGNVMDELVRWRNRTTILLDEINPVVLPRSSQGEVAQLRVAMKEASLFAFRFQCIGS